MWLQFYEDFKKHMALGVNIDFWLISRKEYSNTNMGTQYQLLGSVERFAEWLREQAIMERNGQEFKGNVTFLVGGSHSESRL
jgi:hypothetical protein